MPFGTRNPNPHSGYLASLVRGWADRDIRNRSKKQEIDLDQQDQREVNQILGQYDPEDENSYRSTLLRLSQRGTPRAQTLQDVLAKSRPAKTEIANPEDFYKRGNEWLPVNPNYKESEKSTTASESYLAKLNREMSEIETKNPKDPRIAQYKQAIKRHTEGTMGNIPAIVVTGEGAKLVNKKTGQASDIIMPDGTVAGLPPTTDQRNRIAALKKVEPVLSSISELSEKINVGKGVSAKITGEVEKAKALANLNDDVAEYNALISGFTPLIARGLGHSGVLTQQDVDSVKELFPKPGDSKSLRDRKLARIRTIIGDISEQATGQEQTVTQPSKMTKEQFMQDFLNEEGRQPNEEELQFFQGKEWE